MPRIQTLIFAAVLLAGAIHAEEPSILSVCEVLDHRLEYNGKIVIVFGRLLQTIEGGGLFAECGGTRYIAGTDWTYEIALTYQGEGGPPPAFPSGFRWRREWLIAKLPQGTDATRLVDEPACERRTGWSAVYGRFETKEDGRNRGYGHLNGSPAQLSFPENGRFCLASETDEYGPAGRDSSWYLWTRIKLALRDDGGRAYFESSMKDALVPGPGIGVRVLKGTVISSTPAASPTVLLVDMLGTRTPEATLRLNAPLGKPIPSGTPVEFEGVASEFVANPFMVTFEVPLGNLKINN